MSFFLLSYGSATLVNTMTNEIADFSPTITLNKETGLYEARNKITLPEGVYVLRGEMHSPDTVGRICQITDRVLVLKSNPSTSPMPSKAVVEISGNNSQLRPDPTCWDDFDLIGEVPDYRDWDKK